MDAGDLVFEVSIEIVMVIPENEVSGECTGRYVRMYRRSKVQLCSLIRCE